MNKTLYIRLMILFAANLTAGCASIVVPYNETPLCSKGVSGGYCASLTEVYESINVNIKDKGSYTGPHKKELPANKSNVQMEAIK